jgi:hypothetical protein
MKREEVKALFEAEEERFKNSWLKKATQPVDETVFKEWIIAQIAAMSAAIKCLRAEARKSKGKK